MNMQEPAAWAKLLLPDNQNLPSPFFTPKEASIQTRISDNIGMFALPQKLCLFLKRLLR